MANRTSTSSSGTAQRLRSKTSELSDLLRRREPASSPSSPSTSLAASGIPSPVVSNSASTSTLTSTKSKRRIPFLGLRKKSAESGNIAVPSSSTPAPPPLPSDTKKERHQSMLASPRSSAIPAPFTAPKNIRSSRPVVPPINTLQTTPLHLNTATSPNSISRPVSPATLKPSRSITPTSTRIQSPASRHRKTPSSSTSHSSRSSNLGHTAKTSSSDGRSPAITVSPSTPGERAPVYRASMIATPAGKNPSAGSGLRTPARVDFPKPSPGFLSDSEIGVSSKIRERKGSFLDRLRNNRSANSRSSVDPGSLKKNSQPGVPSPTSVNHPSTVIDISPPPLPPKSVQQRQQADASSVHGAEPARTSPQSGSPVAVTTPETKSSASSSPISGPRRRSVLPDAAPRNDSISSGSSRAPSVIATRAIERASGSPSGSPRSESPVTATRAAVPPSKLGSVRPILRSPASSSSSVKSVSRVQSQTPPSPSVSWVATKPTSAAASPMQESGAASQAPVSAVSKSAPTRGRSSSDSRMLQTGVASGPSEGSPTLSPNVDSRVLRRSFQGPPGSTRVPGAITSPPTGPLPDPPADPPAFHSAVAQHFPIAFRPPRTTSMVSSTTASSGASSLKTLSSMSTIATSVSSASMSSRAGNLRTIPSNASLNSVANSQDEKGGPKPASGKSRPVPTAARPPQKPSPPNSPHPLAANQPVVIAPLAPTPANIYALQSENAALKAKIEGLERSARRYEREIRGLRWLVVNGTNTQLGFASVGQQDKASVNAQCASPLPPPPPPQAPGTRPLILSARHPLSDSEALSDGTTEVGSPSDHGCKSLRGFESDTGIVLPASRIVRPSVLYSSASETSGGELAARKRPLALERARAARERAGRVLGRSLGVEFAVDVDLAAEPPAELASILEFHNFAPLPTGETPPASPPPSSSSSGTPTSPISRVSSHEAVSVLGRAGESGAGAQKEDVRTAQLKRLSSISTSAASIHATLGVGARSDEEKPRRHMLSRGLTPSIEQIMQSDKTNESLRDMDEMVDRLKAFASNPPSPVL